ncbi:PAS domain-containing protein [Halomicrobium urmianum]|uniref:PAS domain-containing protein n=1 Tax=Halomicrobium urmianum TaxID=1586233 RepID=UPI001CD9D2BC|nr:PAS domain-containing protein [Halomicrobium urmianum]
MSTEPLTEALDETLAVFEEFGAPLTTPEVADALDLGRRSAYARLDRLADCNRLETKKVGAGARVWWQPSPGPSAGATDGPADSWSSRGPDAASRDRSGAVESLVADVLDDVDVGIFVLDERFDVVWANAATEQYFGIDREQVVGEDKRRLVDESISATVEDPTAFAETVLATYDDNTDTERFECHVTSGDEREARWLEHRSRPIESGAFAGGRVELYYDVTERREGERRLRRERDLTEQLVETAPIRFAVFGPDGSIRRSNSTTREQFGIDESDAGTVYFDDLRIYDADGDPISPGDHPVQRVLETGEPVSDVLFQHDGPGEKRRWLSLTATPLYDEGAVERVVVAGKDVTELKRAERQLERQRDELRNELDEVFDRIDDAVHGLDEDWRFTYVNERSEELLGQSETELLGEHVWDAFPEDRDHSYREQYERARETQEPVTFEEFSEAADAWLEVTAYPSESGLSVYFRDVTERKERERRLEEARGRYRALVDNFPNGAVTLVDEDCRYVTVGGTPVGLTEVARANLDGRRVRDVLPGTVADVVAPHYEAALDGEPAAFEETINGRTYQFNFVPVRDDDGDVFAAMGLSQDVSSHRRYEDRLRGLYESARGFLTADTESDVSDVLVEAASGVLDLPGVVAYEYDPEADELVPGAASVKADFMRTELPSVSAGDGSITGRAFAAGEIRHHADVRESPHLQVPPDATEMRAGMFVPLGSAGILVAGSREVGSFDSDTRQLVELLATNAEAAYERVSGEARLRRQREQLAALNSLNEVVREITDAVIDRSTRTEIEQTVCDHLADADSYEFAWIGDADPVTETVTLRTEAGVEGYLDGITISIDPDDDRSGGPTGRAFQTGELQTTHDIDADRRHDPWRDHVESYDVRSSAAIPIVHGDTVYGVLNVYADRPFAFEGQEVELVAQIGEIVGHAIAAAERKQALMSDEVVELEFRIQDVFAALDAPVDAPVDAPGSVTLDHTVPVGDGEFLVYGTARVDATGTLSALVDAIGHREGVTIQSAGDPVGFRLRMTDPPVLSVLASLGGQVERAVIEDGDYQMTIHLPPSVDVRRVIDAVEGAYPEAEMLRRRQTTQARDDFRQNRGCVLDDLTERQRAALDAAFHGGYFEWPRETTAEEIADALGVAPSTLHQHLRKAERTVLGAVYSAAT